MGTFIEEKKVVNVKTNQRIDTMESSLNQKLDEVQNDLDQKIGNLQYSISSSPISSMFIKRKRMQRKSV